MVTEQDEEDDKLRWRVDTEVAAAVAEIRAAADTQQEAAESRADRLREQLAAAEQRVAGLTSELRVWEASVAERDAELRNLQARTDFCHQITSCFVLCNSVPSIMASCPGRYLEIEQQQGCGMKGVLVKRSDGSRGCAELHFDAHFGLM